MSHNQAVNATIEFSTYTFVLPLKHILIESLSGSSLRHRIVTNYQRLYQLTKSPHFENMLQIPLGL